MTAERPIRGSRPEPVRLHHQAMDNLRYIRSTMENAGSFTAVPGVGGMLMGATALLAAFAAHLSRSPHAWLGIWGFELALAITIGVAFSARKALRNGSSLFSRSFRRFVLAMVPAVFSGALLTTVLFRNGDHALIPSVWLLLYGVSVSSGGAFSVRAVPLMGASFLVVGAIAAVSPAEWGDALMALGFGGLHIVFGYVIAKDFGG